MPSIILAPIKISAVSSNGTVNFGDTLYISPKSTSKSASGSGGGNTGDFMLVNNVWNITNTIDPDISDSNNLANF
ncbi:spore germination protein [Alkalihalobacillus sp. AL-G]|uniref:spore germination protein n=1 Tax=Alkalihalobacillus sp. AL-G TaxID=2926399 RepID=UPI00272C9023|nr:spore germination protein [Alkalihalobacillus sp. AL-G]WLD91593.1 spore germination protein [Alkalihalobacillus sp. AL-G]